MVVPSAFFTLLCAGTVCATSSEKNLGFAGALFGLAGLLIISGDHLWLTWYWLVGALPLVCRAYFYKESPIRKNNSIVNVETNPFIREWSDPMIVSNVVYLIAAAISYIYGQYHLSFICVCNFWSSCVYHRERETAWYNYDSTFAQFQGFMLMWVLYCSAPSTATMFDRIDAITYDGFTKGIEALIGVLSPFADDRDFRSGLNIGTSEEFTVCQRSDEYFWVMILCIPIGMLLLESGGENAVVIPALHPGKPKISERENSDKPLSFLGTIGTIGTGVGGMCYCARNVNPRYERYHPMWHLLSLAGPLLCTIYFRAHCEESHSLGSRQLVTIPFLPFVETLQLPLVPTMLIIVSLLNSVQLNLTGIKPPE